jgi:hypothetical protein
MFTGVLLELIVIPKMVSSFVHRQGDFMSIHKKYTKLQRSKAKQSVQPSRNMPSILAHISKWMSLSLVITSFGTQLALASDNYAQISNSNLSTTTHLGAVSESKVLGNHQVKSVNFERETVSQDTRQIADWVVNSNDNRNMPFVIIDKINAKVFAFNPDGHLRGAAAALLGLSRGDDATPGIGSQKLSTIHSNERTTPAGRFVAFLDTNLRGEEILWVDYNTSVSLHRVHTNNASERRGQRLDSPAIEDNRISFGCINVPVPFYLNVISPAFAGTKGIVYVLPETRSIGEVFALHGFVANNKVVSSK